MPRPPSRPDDRCLPGMEQQPGAGGGRDRRRDHRGAAGHRPGDRARSDGRCRRRVAGAFGYDIEARWRTPMVCDGSPGPPGQAQRAVVSLWSAARAMPGMNSRHTPYPTIRQPTGMKIEYRYSHRTGPVQSPARAESLTVRSSRPRTSARPRRGRRASAPSRGGTRGPAGWRPSPRPGRSPISPARCGLRCV